MFLDAVDLEPLTGKKRRDAQVPASLDRVSVSNTPERNGTSMQGKLQ